MLLTKLSTKQKFIIFVTLNVHSRSFLVVYGEDTK